MLVYILVNVLIIFFGVVVSGFIFKLFSDLGQRPPVSLGFRRNENRRTFDVSNSYIFFFLTALLLLFVTVFRAPDNALSIDYSRYLKYSEIFSQQGIAVSLENPLAIEMEPGLIALMSASAPLSPGTILPFIFITTLLMLIGYFYTYRKYSPIVWLSVLTLVAFGSYYVIFNGIAQAFAIGLTFGAAKYLYERGKIKRSFLKYTAIILLISLLHKSVLVLIPFYFILTHRFNWHKGRDKLVIIMGISLFMLILTFPDFIVDIGMSTLFTEYQAFDGAEKLLTSGTGLYTILRPVLLITFLIAAKKYIDTTDMRDIVGINAIFIFSAINLLSLQIAILQRLSYLFIPFITIFIPLVISRIKTPIRKLKWIVACVIVFLLYGVASTMAGGDVIFKFYWQ